MGDSKRTREVLHFLFSGDLDSQTHGLPLAWLLASCDVCRAIADEEISAFIAAMVASAELAERLEGLRLAVTVDVPSGQLGRPRPRHLTR